jgi:hypothetical protein
MHQKRTFKRIYKQPLDSTWHTNPLATAFHNTHNLLRLPVRRLLTQGFLNRAIRDAKLDVPGRNGSYFDYIWCGPSVYAVDVARAGAGMGEGTKGGTKGVEEGFARCVQDHVGRCEETRGGTDDALDTYNE